MSGPGPVMATLRSLAVPTAVLLMYGDYLDGGSRETKDLTGVCGTGRGSCCRRGHMLPASRQDVGPRACSEPGWSLKRLRERKRPLFDSATRSERRSRRPSWRVKEADDRYRLAEEVLRQAEHDLAALKGEADLLARRVEEARLQQGELLERREQEAAAAEEMQAELHTVEASVGEREREVEEARTGLRSHQERVEGLRRTVGRLESKKSQAALVEVRLRERCRAHENERTRVRGQWEAARREVEISEWRVQALERYLPVLADLLEVGGLLGERTRGMAADLEQRVEAVRAYTEGTARGLRDRGGEEAALQNEYEALGIRAADLRVEWALLEDRRKLLEDELADLRRRHRSPRGLTPADIAGDDADTLAAAVERAERRRDRIGPINPLAEMECAELEERASFLAEQRRDLEASLAQLEDVIRELSEHIERTFGEIFEATREHFASVVASVFPGAKGSLRLTESKVTDRRARPDGGSSALHDLEEEEVVSTDGDDGGDDREQAPGVMIEVKFPNKAPRSLSLLSGGEKAMTAIAFLLSLFLARPCPFYILDEVEASLDDINIRRFLSLVRKYRDRTQFIIITHQRQTMEVADTLYGVTLESDGTSRVLSRRLALSKGA